MVWYGYLEGGFERRHLATVRRTVATAAAFPQKSKSTGKDLVRIVKCCLASDMPTSVTDEYNIKFCAGKNLSRIRLNLVFFFRVLYNVKNIWRDAYEAD